MLLASSSALLSGENWLISSEAPTAFTLSTDIVHHNTSIKIFIFHQNLYLYTGIYFIQPFAGEIIGLGTTQSLSKTQDCITFCMYKNTFSLPSISTINNVYVRLISEGWTVCFLLLKVFASHYVSSLPHAALALLKLQGCPTQLIQAISTAVSGRRNASERDPGKRELLPVPPNTQQWSWTLCAPSSWSNLHRKAGKSPWSTALPTATPGFTHQAQLTRFCHTCAKGPGTGSAHFSRQESARKRGCSAERCRAPERRSILSPSCCPLALISSPF